MGKEIYRGKKSIKKGEGKRSAALDFNKKNPKPMFFFKPYGPKGYRNGNALGPASFSRVLWFQESGRIIHIAALSPASFASRQTLVPFSVRRGREQESHMVTCVQVRHVGDSQ